MKKDSKIAIVMGSHTDFRFFVPVLEKIKTKGVLYECTIASAHRTPERLRAWINEMEKAGVEVIVAAAGGAAHLPGVVAAHTMLPVIGIPLDTSHLRGIDALYSIVQMPAGIPVATVGINSVENGILLALHILAIKYPQYRTIIEQYRAEMPSAIEEHTESLAKEYPELFQPAPLPPAAEKNDGKLREERAVKDADEKIFEKLEQDFLKFSEERRSERHIREDEDGSSSPEQERKDNDMIERQKNRAKRIESVSFGPKPAIFPVDPRDPDPDVIEEASMVLLDGGIIAIPTDTVYGLGVDATNPTAVHKLFKIKERGEGKAIPILIHDIRQLSSLAKNIPPEIREVMERFWPGALTIVFEKYRNTFMALSQGSTLGIRIPDNIVCLKVLEMTARPMATTSANTSGKEPATTAAQVIRYFGDKIDLVLDSGDLVSRPVSTVLDVSQKPFKILKIGRAHV